MTSLYGISGLEIASGYFWKLRRTGNEKTSTCSCKLSIFLDQDLYYTFFWRRSVDNFILLFFSFTQKYHQPFIGTQTRNLISIFVSQSIIQIWKLSSFGSNMYRDFAIRHSIRFRLIALSIIQEEGWMKVKKKVQRVNRTTYVLYWYVTVLWIRIRNYFQDPDPTSFNFQRLKYHEICWAPTE